jgi:hypothetical protein
MIAEKPNLVKAARNARWHFAVCESGSREGTTRSRERSGPDVAGGTPTMLEEVANDMVDYLLKCKVNEIEDKNGL